LLAYAATAKAVAASVTAIRARVEGALAIMEFPGGFFERRDTLQQAKPESCMTRRSGRAADEVVEFLSRSMRG
jgi:hypothetical protein